MEIEPSSMKLFKVEVETWRGMSAGIKLDPQCQPEKIVPSLM
jgi:hypothetical protein